MARDSRPATMLAHQRLRIPMMPNSVVDEPPAPEADDEYDRLLTVNEVATLLRVPPHGSKPNEAPRAAAIAQYQTRKIRAVRTGRGAGVPGAPAPGSVTRMGISAAIRASELRHEEPTRGKDISRMARAERQYGSGCVLDTKGGFAIRWRELEIAPDGTIRRVLRYATVGRVPRKRACQILAEKIAAAGGKTLSRVTFRTVTDQWLNTVLPIRGATRDSPVGGRAAGDRGVETADEERRARAARLCDAVG